MAKSDPTRDAPTAPADSMQHLRQLVVGKTQTSLDELRQEVAQNRIGAKEVGVLLPEAIKRSAASGPDLAKAIGPTFSDAFEESVRRDPQALADAVSPIMGPAIQRYIQQQIQAMVQSLNTALDHSLSPKGMRWRLEAWKTGKPFAEVVLLHTLIYRIEQVMLIDPETGMLMQSTSSSTSDDADLVSSLLTAIQDFMRDSFRHRSNSGSDLQEIQTNELTVWMQHGSAADIAVAIRGEAPLSLRQKIQALLDRIHVQYRPLLENFRGDTSPLDLVRPDLEELLESEFVGKKEHHPKESASPPVDPMKQWWKKQLRWMIPTAIALATVAFVWDRQRANYRRYLTDQLDLPTSTAISLEGNIVRIEGTARKERIDNIKNRFDAFADQYQLDLHQLEVSDQPWVNFVSSLRREPGITVARTERSGNLYRVFGWRDAESADPDQIREQCGIPSEFVEQQWDLVPSSDPRFILRQLTSRGFVAPHDVELRCDQTTGKIVISGRATVAEIADLRSLAFQLDVIDSLDLRHLNPTQ